MNIKSGIFTALALFIFSVSSSSQLLADEKMVNVHKDEHEHHHGDDGHANEHEHHHGDDGHANEHEHHHGENSDGSDQDHHHHES